MTEQLTSGLIDYLGRHYTSIKSRLGRIVGNADLAADALQDTWLRLQAREEEETVHNPAGYILRIGVNIAIDMQRRQSRAVSLDEINAAMELADPAPATDHVAQVRAELQQVFHHIDQLPKRQRTVLLMVHVEGMGQKEIAQSLGISLRTVEADLKKAHDYLAACRSSDV